MRTGGDRNGFGLRLHRTGSRKQRAPMASAKLAAPIPAVVKKFRHSPASTLPSSCPPPPFNFGSLHHQRQTLHFLQHCHPSEGRIATAKSKDPGEPPHHHPPRSILPGASMTTKLTTLVVLKPLQPPDATLFLLSPPMQLTIANVSTRSGYRRFSAPVAAINGQSSRLLYARARPERSSRRLPVGAKKAPIQRGGRHRLSRETPRPTPTPASRAPTATTTPTTRNSPTATRRRVRNMFGQGKEI